MLNLLAVEVERSGASVTAEDISTLLTEVTQFMVCCFPIMIVVAIIVVSIIIVVIIRAIILPIVLPTSLGFGAGRVWLRGSYQSLDFLLAQNDSK